MKALAAAFLLVAFTACEKKPSEEEVEMAAQKKAVEAAKPTPMPTPKPGSWMYKDLKNPLEKKPAGK